MREQTVAERRDEAAACLILGRQEVVGVDQLREALREVRVVLYHRQRAGEREVDEGASHLKLCEGLLVVVIGVREEPVQTA